MTKSHRLKIVKRSGYIVEFNQHKLRDSLLKSGADVQVVEQVLQKIKNELYDGISTKQIYQLAFRLLKKAASSHAARYNLRAAIRELGPAGFFFEKYIARLFDFEGYDTRTNVFLQGKCVRHEIDIVIGKNNRIEMVECKFHNGPEANSDVKVPMYILSRFNDLRNLDHAIFSAEDRLLGCYIATNNRFTADAITFADCMGLDLLSWDHPVKHNLKTMIDQHGLYPTTCLTTLSMVEKEKLLILDLLLVSEVIANREALEKIGLSANRIKNVLKEASELTHR